MNNNFKDLSGKRFGMLTVTNEYESRRGATGHTHIYWKCLCDCGRELWVRGVNLTYGTTRGCGHHRADLVKHGMSKERIYIIYYGMLQRCNNKNSPAYRYYGGRGISVCDSWTGKDGFANFCSWSMSNGYDDNLTIDRINVDGNYEPNNCRWVTNGVQQRNKRNNKYIEYEGELVIATDAADAEGISRRTLYERIKRGWSDDSIYDNVKKNPREVVYEGVRMNLRQLSERTGISFDTLNTRYSKGYSDEDIVAGRYEKAKIPVQQIDSNGDVVGEFESATDAHRKTGIRLSGIIMCCNGQRNKCGGFGWRHHPDYKPIEKVERSLRLKDGGGWIDSRGKKIS